MTTLGELKSQHPEWCFSCGKWWLEAEGLHTCHEHPVVAALLAKAEEDEAKIAELEAQLAAREAERDDETENVLHLAAELGSTKNELTAERQSHEATKQALAEVDEALIEYRDNADPGFDGPYLIYLSALGRQQSRTKEKK